MIVLQFPLSLHGKESTDNFKASQGWVVDQVNGAEASSECVSSQEPEGERDAAQLSAQLRSIGFSSVYEVNVQVWQNVDSNEPGYTAWTEEEIVPAMSRPDESHDKPFIVEPAVPSYSKAYACLSTYIWWLEAQVNWDLVCVQILCPLQKNAMSKQGTKLM